MIGRYIAIGAGQAADLITLRGLKALKDADVVLYDRLIDEELLSYATGLLVAVGKHPYRECISQHEINSYLTKYLSDGKTVARLKGGDSLIFSRVNEEIACAHLVGAEVEIIPGVSAASSAMAKAVGGLTDRCTASGVLFITGHGKADEVDCVVPEYNWQLMAGSNFTIAVYMGIKHIGDIANQLMKYGKSKDTPVLIAESICTADERLTLTNLTDVESKVLALKVSSPAVFIIGDVLKYAEIFNSVDLAITNQKK